MSVLTGVSTHCWWECTIAWLNEKCPLIGSGTWTPVLAWRLFGEVVQLCRRQNLPGGHLLELHPPSCLVSLCFLCGRNVIHSLWTPVCMSPVTKLSFYGRLYAPWNCEVKGTPSPLSASGNCASLEKQKSKRYSLSQSWMHTHCSSQKSCFSVSTLKN